MAEINNDNRKLATVGVQCHSIKMNMQNLTVYMPQSGYAKLISLPSPLLFVMLANRLFR